MREKKLKVGWRTRAKREKKEGGCRAALSHSPASSPTRTAARAGLTPGGASAADRTVASPPGGASPQALKVPSALGRVGAAASCQSEDGASSGSRSAPLAGVRESAPANGSLAHYEEGIWYGVARS